MTDERRIERLARRLGEGADEQIDPESTAEAVIVRLRSSDAVIERRWWVQFRVLRAAAAVMMIAGAGLVWWSSDRGASHPGFPTVDGLRELATTELVEVLDSLEAEAPVAELVPTGLHDLNENELSELLAMMEG